MLRIRIKMSPQQQLRNNREWTCCFGLHVHTATIMIGLWHLFLNILALSLLAVIWRNPHMMEELENSYDYTVDLNAPALPTPLSKVDPPYAYRDHSVNYRKQYQNFDVGGLVCTCMIAITLMMIYGTIKGKPSHLLPFFCLQLFDFAITTLTAAGYLCYLQAIHRLIAESRRLPWREKLLELTPEELVVVVLIVFVCIVFLKAYAIGIVWRCYKYLTLRQQNIRTLLPCVLPDLSGRGGGGIGGNLGAEERAYSTLLPNYDEAIAQFMKQAPPPSYQVAMSNYQMESSDDEGRRIVIGTGAGVAAGGVNAGSDSNDESIDNNNDISNNNNTVHINANTPPPAAVRRNNENATTNSISEENEEEEEEVDESDGAERELTPPPAYNDCVLVVNTNEQQPQQQQQQHFIAALRRNVNNESQA